MVVQLAKQLSQLGYDVDMVAFKITGNPDFPNCEELWSNTQVKVIPIIKYDDPNQQLLEFVNEGSKFLRNSFQKYDRIILAEMEALIRLCRILFKGKVILLMA